MAEVLPNSGGSHWKDLSLERSVLRERGQKLNATNELMIQVQLARLEKDLDDSLSAHFNALKVVPAGWEHRFVEIVSNIDIQKVIGLINFGSISGAAAEQTVTQAITVQDIYIFGVINSLEKGLIGLLKNLAHNSNETRDNMQTLIVAFSALKRQVDSNSDSQYYDKVSRLVAQSMETVSKEMGFPLSLEELIYIKADVNKLIEQTQSIAVTFTFLTATPDETSTEAADHKRVKAYKAQAQLRGLRNHYARGFNKLQAVTNYRKYVTHNMTVVPISEDSVNIYHVFGILTELMDTIEQIRRSWGKT